MLTLEEYIAKRKREDNINEFDLDSRNENMQISVNYVFEFFNQYLEELEIESYTVLNNERLLKFRNQLRKYAPDIQDWLVNIYNEYDKQLQRSIISLLKKEELFLLYHTDSEFRALSYDCYAGLLKKNTFLKGQTEMLYIFIKDYHHIISQPDTDINSIFIAEEINEWVEKAWLKYKVNLFTFASDWVNRFYDNKDKWPIKHRIKSDDTWIKYEYDIKQKSNLFNVNLFYKKVSNKPFLRGKKQYLEILLMYFWINEIDHSQADYWEKYLTKVLKL
ncbi:hypothetical protein [Ornithinibacillus bavariensis]|uniref:hypothetical protein n=1 Tax=Ornithinibacillus bavariensis TaxID=545502 RepID=UPI000ED58387|nr:hypothetical protein [Ornithinibacillus sp.]